MFVSVILFSQTSLQEVLSKMALRLNYLEKSLEMRSRELCLLRDEVTLQALDYVAQNNFLHC